MGRMSNICKPARTVYNFVYVWVCAGTLGIIFPLVSRFWGLEAQTCGCSGIYGFLCVGVFVGVVHSNAVFSIYIFWWQVFIFVSVFVFS